MATYAIINSTSNRTFDFENSSQIAENVSILPTTALTLQPVNVHGKTTLDTIDAVRFYSSVLATIFICMGLCGNSFSIMVWKRKRMWCSTGIYLIGQAIADSFLLVFFFMVESLPAIAPAVTTADSYGVFYAYFGYPFFYFFLVCSIWFTVGVTIDRFIQVQWPLQAKKFCSEKKACTGLVLMAVVNFLINIPHFATYEPVQQDIRNNVEPSYRKSQFGKSEGSHHYEFWVHCIFLVFGPWIGILILNIFIIRQVAGVNKNIGRRRSIHGNKKTQRAESQLTRILLSVSFAFLILIFPECIAKCFFMLKAGDPELVPKALSIAKTGVVINSSINFCLYCLSGKKFRTELRSLVCSLIYTDYETSSTMMLSETSSSSVSSRTKSTISNSSTKSKISMLKV